LEKTLDFFGKLDGVIRLKILDDAEKRSLLEIESRNEEKKFMGMCRTYNKAARDAISRRRTLAIITKGGEFKYLPLPRMRMMYKDDLVGEELYESERLEALRESKDNVFLWDNFAVFRKKLPKGKTELDQLVIVHTPTSTETSKESIFTNLVLGEPCGESDQVIKGWFEFETREGVFGTVLIGFDDVSQ